MKKINDININNNIVSESSAACCSGAADAVEMINGFERFGNRVGLERMEALMELLGNPQDELKIIHVAGTNGKGSICRYIYSTLEAADYRTGIYTSPFLERFNERIEVSGELISDEDLKSYTDRVLEKIKVITDNGHTMPTEFEVITAIAFLYFKEKKCDYVVLEVGLGGRGDSTNVCKNPLVSVIASISLDHTDRLGNTIAEIAAEKAGIIKDHSPVVTTAESDEALAVIEKTAEEHQAMCFETRHIPHEVLETGLFGTKFNADIQGVLFNNLEISMAGEHQVKNAIGALAAICIMEENGNVKIPRQAIYEGFKNARQPGRLEIIKRNFILDGAHNEDGAGSLEKAIQQYCKNKKILMVTGILTDKDADGVLKHLVNITKDFIVTEPDCPRKIAAGELAAKLEKLGANCITEADPAKATELAAAKVNSKEYDVAVFAGSLYLIGQVRGILR